MKALTHLKDIFLLKRAAWGVWLPRTLEKCFLGLAKQEHLHDCNHAPSGAGHCSSGQQILAKRMQELLLRGFETPKWETCVRVRVSTRSLQGNAGSCEDQAKLQGARDFGEVRNLDPLPRKAAGSSQPRSSAAS